jgi:Nucleic-acid-binding protein possibly involved in ribosomal biogenesis
MSDDAIVSVLVVAIDDDNDDDDDVDDDDDDDDDDDEADEDDDDDDDNDDNDSRSAGRPLCRRALRTFGSHHERNQPTVQNERGGRVDGHRLHCLGSRHLAPPHNMTTNKRLEKKKGNKKEEQRSGVPETAKGGAKPRRAHLIDGEPPRVLLA